MSKKNTLLSNFLSHVAAHPDTPAVSCDGETLTYAELDQRATQIAHILCEKGVGQDTPVAICMDRSIDIIVSVIAALRAGGAYLPLDAAYPRDRLSFMISDSETPVLLTHSRLRKDLADLAPYTLEIDQPLPSCDPHELPTPNPDDLAYVIYTSGSTGKPKGVLCHHRAAVHMLSEAERQCPLGPGDRCSWWTSLCFDVSVYEIFSVLTAGAELVIVPEHIRVDGPVFVEWLHTQKIVAGYVPPMMTADFEAWVVKNIGESRMHRLFVGVETLPEKRLLNLARLIPDVFIINAYGPTETAVYSIAYCLDASTVGDPSRMAPIGKPLTGLEVYLLDPAGKPVLDGDEGEIYIGGPQVERGYLKRPEKTAHHFLDNPWMDGNMYRTGDLGERLPDGNIMFRGRIDTQVKFLGYRIELGEIESALCRMENLRESVVIIREDVAGDRRLVGYYTAQGDTPPSPQEIRDHLSKDLPVYMVPSILIRLEKISLTSNGKTDRRALPAPSAADLENLRATEFKPPVTDSEKAVAAAFCATLNLKQVGLDDHFFALGGHSLLATQMLSKLHCDLTLKDVYEFPTLGKLAKKLTDLTPAPTSEIGHQHPITSPITASQRTMWMLHQSDREGVLSNIPLLYRIQGPLDCAVVEQTLNEIIRRHDALRMTFFVKDGDVFQTSEKELHLPVVFTDLSHLGLAKRDQKNAAIALAAGRSVFNLETGPLLYAEIVQLAPERFDLYLTIHHIASDGWGASVLQREFVALYKAFIQGKPSPLPPLDVQYSDIAVWKNNRRQSGELQPQLDYWKDKLAAPRPDHHFQLDHPRPAVSKHQGTRRNVLVPPEQVADLNALAKRENVSLYMLLTAIWQTLLQRATGATDLITGTVIANRNHPQTENVIGNLINALALRTDFTAVQTFSDLLQQIRNSSLEAYANQDIPYETVMQAVNDGTTHPLFRNSLILHNMPIPAQEFAGLRMVGVEIGNATAKLDTLLYLVERDGQLEGQLEYDKNLFDVATIETLLYDLLQLAKEVVHHVDRPLAELLQNRDDEAPTAFVIGEGTLCLRCIETLKNRGLRVLGLISPDAANRRWANEHAIPWSHPKDGFKNILSAQPFDYLFSIVNSHILRPDVLSLPRRCAINYHDAPLPRYAGVYSTAWAIINREKQHGISWHIMAEEVDAGDLLKQRLVDIDPEDTSFTLNAKCYAAAILSLDTLAVELVENRETLTPQDLSQRSYYPLHKRPDNAAVIDWTKPPEEIAALRRALDFGIHPNEFALPKVCANGELFILRPDDTVVSFDGEPRDVEFEKTFPTLGKKLEPLNAEIARHEDFWIRRFKAFQPLEKVEGDHETHPLKNHPLFLCFLARLTAQNNFSIGWKTPTDAPELFSETVPLNIAVEPAETLGENLARVAKTIALCKKHKTYIRDLFLRIPDLPKTPDYSILLSAQSAHCSSNLWKHFCAFEKAADENAPLFAQSILTEKDQAQLDIFQAQQPGFADTRCIYQLFEEQAQKTPSTIAVESIDGSLTYAQLNQRADTLAAHLIENGVHPDTPVGLFVDRSLEMCIGILGILKAGGAYVPLDPEYPADRLEWMIQDTATPIIVTVSNLRKKIPEAEHALVCIDQLSEKAFASVAVSPENLAYVFYTSGSTGKPKGVMVEHRNVVNHCRASIETYGISADSRVLQFFSMNFDGSVEELFPAWAVGGTVVLRTPELSSSVREFERFIDDQKITLVDLQTAYWHEWVRNVRALPETLRSVIIGGEKVSAERCRIWLEKTKGAVRLFNTYGPTECTVVATVYELTDTIDGEIPIGSPIADTALYVADKNQQLVPVGTPGELLIGGAGVARGYLNRDDLTDKQFISNPWKTGRLYRTGDLVAWQPNGKIAFMGRVDNQVKIRGFRIEPDEVAVALEQHPAIAQAVVIGRTDMSDQKELAAYLVFESTEQPAVKELRAFLGESLPEYMIPSAFVTLDELPIAPTGKVDRNALPIPQKAEAEAREDIVLPQTPEQIVLAEIWSAVLGVEPIGINENFFDLGGHSLLAIQLVERIHNSGQSLTVAQLFQHPTIAEMATIIGTRSVEGSEDYKSLVCLKKGSPGKTPFFLLHSAPGDLLGYTNLVHNLPSDQPVYGFQSLGLSDIDQVHSTIEEMAAYYVSILTEFYPSGPYLIGGWCYGGYIAMEMARQLKEQGKEIPLLALIDAWAYTPAERKIAFYRHRLQLLRVVGFRAELKIILARLKTRLLRETANVDKMLDGVHVETGVLANREEVYRRNRKAALKYAPRYYPGNVTIFRPDELNAALLPDLAMEWETLTEDQDIHLIPGGHRGMLHEPDVKTLAKRLQKSLKKASRE